MVVCAVSAFLLAGNASAQFSGQVKVSNAIEVPSGTQSAGVTAARCGNNIVVGFGDQESSSKNSFAGYSVSHNGGTSFSDLGVLPVTPTVGGSSAPDQLGANGRTELPGGNDPSVACANSNLFYYASVYTDNGNGVPGGGCFFPFCPAISLSISHDGGTTWGLPKVIATASGDIHNLLFVSMAVDPANPKRLYVGYLNHNFATPADFGFPDCGNADIYEVRVVSSANGGTTWADNVVDHACTLLGNPTPDHLGLLASPTVAVSPDGKVDVAYQFIPANGMPNQPNQIRFSESVDHGITFSTPLKVSTALGDATPRLAVDRTTSAFRGTIYLTWSGMPRGTTTEVLMSDSVNQGASFSFPRSVRSTSQGTQINPVLAVDNDGQVANCYYVTGTNTPTSSSNYFYNCLTSFNHAATWTGYQKLVSSAPAGYDSLTSDFLLGSDGFFTAFEVPTSGQRHVVGAKADN
jgi:hypothetical protein